MITRFAYGLAIVLISLMIFSACQSSDDSSNSTNDFQRSRLSGTITLSSDAIGKSYYIGIDTNGDLSDGVLLEATGDVENLTLTYSFSDITPDTYYLGAYVDADSTMEISNGDFYAFYDGRFLPPIKPNINLEEGNSVTADFSLNIIGDAIDGSTTVSGVISLPEEVVGQKYMVGLDTDFNFFNDISAMTMGDISGDSFTYEIRHVPAGIYYLFVLTGDGTSLSIEDGVYFGYYGSTGFLPPSGANANVPGTGDVTFDFELTKVGSAGTGETQIQGTVTLPEIVSDKTGVVILDTNSDFTDGFVTAAASSVSDDSYQYTINDVSSGNYYLYAVAGDDITFSIDAIEYIGFYGTNSFFPPTSANVAVPASGDVTFDIGTIELGSANAGETNIQGTISLPAAVDDKLGIVFLDGDMDYSNGFHAMSTGIIDSDSFSYSIKDVAAGRYLIYGIVDLDGDFDLSTGDYVGCYGSDSLFSCYLTAPKATIPSSGTVIFNMTFSLNPF